MQNRKKTVLLIVNIFLLVTTVIFAARGISYGAGEGQPGNDMVGLGYLKAFTNLSNIYLGICAAILLIYHRREKLPDWTVILYFTAACATGLTFLVVLVFLGPMFQINGSGYFTMYAGEMFFFHFLNPLLGALALMFLIPTPAITQKQCLLGVVPTVFYSVLYIVHVIILRDWIDFYNFTLGGHFELTPVVAVVIYGVTYLIARLLMSVHNRHLV